MENDDFWKSVLAGLARHAATTLGGILVTHGYLASTQQANFTEITAGVIITGVATAWSYYQKTKVVPK